MVLRSDAWVALPVLRCLGGILQAAPLARARALRVAASGTWGCSLGHSGLQPLTRRVAASGARECSTLHPAPGTRHPAGGAARG